MRTLRYKIGLHSGETTILKIELGDLEDCQGDRVETEFEKQCRLPREYVEYFFECDENGNELVVEDGYEDE